MLNQRFGRVSYLVRYSFVVATVALAACSGGSTTLAPVRAVASASPVASAHATPTPTASPTIAPASKWVTGWTNVMSALSSQVTEQTFRTIARPSVGSRGTVRVRVSNALGTAPVTIGALHVGLVSSGAAVVPATDVAVSFAGSPTITIPAGATAYSDVAKLTYSFGALVAVTTYVSGTVPSVPQHNTNGLITQYATAAGAGNMTTDLTGASFATVATTSLVDRIDLYGVYTGTVAFAGSSTTVGAGADANEFDTLVDDVANELHSAGRDDLAIANLALAPEPLSESNDVGTSSVLARLATDYLTLPSLRTIVQNAGDIDLKVKCDTATQVIAAEQTFVSQVHAAGVRAVLAVIAPTTYCNGQNPSGYGTRFPANSGEDAERQLLNGWIVSTIPSTVENTPEAAPAADAVVDLSTPITDPANTGYMSPQYDVGDDSHVNAAGQLLQAQAIPISVL